MKLKKQPMELDFKRTFTVDKRFYLLDQKKYNQGHFNIDTDWGFIMGLLY